MKDVISMGDWSPEDKDGIIYGDLVLLGWKALHYVLWAGGFTVIQGLRGSKGFGLIH